MTTNEHGQPVGEPAGNWSGALPPPRCSMVGRYCELRVPADTAYCKDLYNAFISDSEGINWTYLPYGPFDSFAEFEQWFEMTCLADDPLFHVVIDVQQDKAVGLASYLRIKPDAGSIEVGHIHYSPLMQRTPMATESMYLMMQRVFDELNYRRYEWKCDALNEPSRKAAARLGFVYEGTFRQALTYKSRNRDTAWLSVIDSEWPPVKRAMEAWLAPENFDNAGQQRRSLASLQANRSE